MVQVQSGQRGGIGALYSILLKHFGAVERDLFNAGVGFSDVGTERMSFRQFKNFVLYAPPGTSVFHYRNEGWVVGDHLAAFQLDMLKLLFWAKTIDGQKNINRPEQTPRPGVADAATQDDDEMSPFTVTVAEYQRMLEEFDAAEAAKHEGED